MKKSTNTAANIETVSRTCPFCEAHCSVELTVDKTAGKVLKLRGNKSDPFSQGFICPKALALKELRDDPDILTKPVRRKGDKFEEIEWEEAFTLVAEGLNKVRQQGGNNAISVFAGNAFSHHLGQVLYLGPLMMELGTQNFVTSGSIDVWPKLLSSSLMFGAQATFLVPDIDRTDFMLIIGANPVVSNGSLMTAPDMPRRLKAIRKRGGSVVVIDPRRTETAKLADQYLPIRPASDALLLFAMIDTMFKEDLIALGHLEGHVRDFDELKTLAKQFSPEAVAERTGIDADDIRDLTRRFSAANSAVVYCRIGGNLQEFGSLTMWLVDVLNVLTGNFDRVGGMMVPDNIVPSQLYHEKYEGDTPPFTKTFSRVKGLPMMANQLPIAALADEMETEGEGQIRGFVTVGSNPARSTPNSERLAKAFSNLDFMVCIDRYINETTRHADIIIPMPDPCELPDFPILYSPYMVRAYAKWSEAIFDPTPDMPRDYESLLEITARLANKTPQEIDDAYVDMMLALQLSRNSKLADVDVVHARKLLGDRMGPERLSDLLVRTGAYGDGFGKFPEGLTLEKIRAQPEGVVEMGPIKTAGLDVLIHTPDKKIHLAPEMLVNDVPRLLEAFHKPIEQNSLLLIARRQLRSNLSWLHNVYALVKGSDRCTLQVNPIDAERLGLQTGMKATVRSSISQLDAPIEVTDEMMQGVVCLPFGWGHTEPNTRLSVASQHPGVNYNALVDEQFIEPLSAGSATNGIPVVVEALSIE